MTDVSREHLRAYLDDALSEPETARLESLLRTSEPLRARLRDVLQERDRGDHSLGAIWRRERLTCPTREQIGSFVLEVLEPDYHDYVDFHLKVVGCSFCQANLDDLREQQAEAAPKSHRRKRYFDSSAGLLKKR